MFPRIKANYLETIILITCISTLVSTSVLSQEVVDDPPEPASDPMPEPETAPEPESTPPPAPVQATTPAPAPAGQPPTIVYAAPVDSSVSHAQGMPLGNPYLTLRRQPKRLKPIEGQEPPFGYVEVVRRKRGLVAAGAAVFGGVYIGCVALSTFNRALLIPIVGPAIAGFGADSDVDDAVYAARLYGTLGTLFQTAGIVLFSFGMASKKKHWLRQDIAGISIQLSPTVVSRNDPGLGVYGTF